MWRKIFLMTLLALVFGPAQVMAQYQMGDKEFTLSGSGSSDNEFDTTTFSTEFSFGYFYSDNLEGVIRQGVAVADKPGDNSWNGSTRIAVDYHFDMQNVQPYLGVNVGYLYGDDVNETFIGGPEGGIKVFVNETTFIVLSIEYQVLFEDADKADDQFDDGRFVYGLGLGFKW